jgi:ubiquinone/menaquinone biosynthesis C-methylase UbiE
VTDERDRVSAHEAGFAPDIKGEVQRRFGEAAARYTTSPVHAGGEDLARLASDAAAHPGFSAAPVLDAGCGAGHTALALAALGAGRVVALDFTAAMLAQVSANAAARGLSGVQPVQGDVEHLPFADAQFGIVTSRYSAHHYPAPRRALREIARVLRPGGLFLLSDIVAPEAPLADTFLQTVEYLRDGSHVRDHGVREWLALLADVGFSAEVRFTWRLKLDFAAWVERIATPAPQVAMLEMLFSQAGRELREAFAITHEAFGVTREHAEDASAERDSTARIAHFSIDGALFSARKP